MASLTSVQTLHARIQEFSSGGVQVSLTKKALKTFFFFFFSPQLILQNSNGQFQRNLSLFKVPEGVQHFPGGSNFFQGGSNSLFPIETHITCDFPGGVRTPCPPLWIRTCFVQLNVQRTRGSKHLRQLPATNNAYKFSFYPRTISDWNQLPTHITDLQNPQRFRDALANLHSTLQMSN